MGGLGGVYALIELALETPLRISSRLNVSLLLGVGLLKVIDFCALLSPQALMNAVDLYVAGACDSRRTRLSAARVDSCCSQ
jgi:hypothetical protein